MRETARESGENFAPLSKNALKTIFTRFRAARNHVAIDNYRKGSDPGGWGGAKARFIQLLVILPLLRNGKNEVNPGPLPRENDIEYHGCSRPANRKKRQKRGLPGFKICDSSFTRASHAASGAVLRGGRRCQAQDERGF